MDTPSGGGRDSRFSMGYNISLLSGETAPEIYSNAIHNRPSTSITSGLTRSSMSLSSSCSAGMQRGLKRTSSDVCYEQDGRQMGLTGDCGSDIVDDGFTTTPQKGSPPSNGKKTKGRVKIKMEYIDNKLRRYTTFSKRKTGIMKKAYELSTLTGTQVMLLVASETGHVYTFATRKLQPMITSEAGKALIQTCLNSPDPCPSGSGGDQRMSATGFEETELSYNIADEEQKDGFRPYSPAGSEAGSIADSTSSESPPTPNNNFELYEPKCELGGVGTTRRSPPSHLPPAPHSPILSPGNSSTTRANGSDTGNTTSTNSNTSYGAIYGGNNAAASSSSPTTTAIITAATTSSNASSAVLATTSTTSANGQRQTAASTSSNNTAIYHTPNSTALPNGGVLLSVGGGPHYITIPLHLNLPTDLTKSAPK